jgi:Small nuclear RNA activating complex (SNAPc), subunit SNAP43.
MAPLYIAAGFKSDCEELLRRFQNTKSVKVKKFIEVWQEMKFPQILRRRHSFAELLEFTEEVSL